MGGINSLGGLNKVNVDFRPTIDTGAPNNGNQPQNVQQDAPDVQQPGAAAFNSIVKQLDVLLLNAAGKSIAADAARQMQDVGGKLVSKGVLTQDELDELNNLAQDAAEKLRVLDKFSGAELANALTLDEESNLVWSDRLFADGDASNAVKDAVEAQEALSEALSKFNDRLAQSEKVTAAMQDAFTELQFQCDRRSTEIYSVVVRMYDLHQQNVVNNAVPDEKTAALLDATFKELMPREAILMHGTKEAFEKMNETLGAQMRPLAEKLDAFTKNSGRVLDKAELASLTRDIAKMRNAIDNVRKNGIAVGGGRIEVDKSLLAEMDKVLDTAAKSIDGAKKTAAQRARNSFVNEVVAGFFPEKNTTGGEEHLARSAKTELKVKDFVRYRQSFIDELKKFASGELSMKRFDEIIDPIIEDLQELRWKNDNIPNDMPLRDLLAYYAMSEADVKQVLKMINGLNIIKAQFREMMTTTSAMSGFWAKASLSASDVRRIMLGEKGLSGAIEAKALGFKPDDVNPATDDANIVDSKTLGAGNAGTAFLLTSKTGEEFVFKPELDSRLGLNAIYVGMNGAYVNAQKTANLNFATQDTAKIFKCENLVVKYSVGTHNGQFGIFMEKAKGFTGEDLLKRRIKNDKDCDISPSVMRETVTDKEARNRIEAQLAQKFNKLQWLDIITGQQDRHWNNYFINIDKTTHDVTLKAIDNDASFSAKQIGMNKFALDKDAAQKFDRILKNICFDLHGKDGWKGEYDERVSLDPAIVRNQDGSITIDLSKATSTEVKMAVVGAIGMQSPGVVAPEEIDEEFYNVLMEMDGKDSAKRKEYLDSIAPRISPAALKAAESRLDDAIAHAKKLFSEGKVYKQEDWQDAGKRKAMKPLDKEVTVTKNDGTTIKPPLNKPYVSSYRVNSCPSYYKRDYIHGMFP